MKSSKKLRKEFIIPNMDLTVEDEDSDQYVHNFIKKKKPIAEQSTVRNNDFSKQESVVPIVILHNQRATPTPKIAKLDDEMSEQTRKTVLKRQSSF